jgi:oligoendopeptidase F
MQNINYAQNLERNDIPQKYKWNLNDMFPSISDWDKAKNEVAQKIEDVVKYKGHIAESPNTMLEALNNYFDLLKKFYRVSEYASRLSDEDLRIAKYQAMTQEVSHLGTEISEKTAFLSPEIVKITPEKIDSFLKENPKLEDFKMFIGNIQRLRAHTLSEGEEKILASFGSVVETPSNVYDIFNDAEFPYAKVKLSDGQDIILSSSAYTKYRGSQNREDRKLIFENFFDTYGKYKNTLGANYAGKVKTDYVFAKDRNYNSSLEASLAPNNIPISVYENLITQIHNNLTTLQRFLNLKKRMLGVDILHYYDLYTPIVKKVDLKFTIEEGQNIILKALNPMGKEYIETVQKAFNNRWIDYIPSNGKRSGAYSSSAYDVHPYILTNWNGDYESVSTLAHELGHTMHSYFSNKNQTFPNSDYSIFVAEIASTCNETLLNNYMVQNANNDEEKLYLLGSYLELLRTTIFRQTLFAEFEWEVHKLAEQGSPLTGESLSQLYYNLVKEYYGNDKGDCIIDSNIAYEWEYIPHFVNYTYYVYQYATSLIYATAFAEKIIDEGKPAVEKYYNLLKGGGSDYPIEIIKKAGIDPLSSEPFQLTMKRMNDVMDQIETILNKEGK